MQSSPLTKLGRRPNELSYLAAFITCMSLLAISYYHFPISYWLNYVRVAPTEFGYSALHGEVWRLVLGEFWLLLILIGTILCMREKHTSVGVAMVITGILSETGSIPLLGFYLSVVEPVSGLYWLYTIFFTPFFLLFSIFFIYAAIKRRVDDPRILYSIIAISFIPISLNVASWIMSGYVGTGGGLFLLALSFFVGWTLIWLGGLFSFRFGSFLIIIGAILNWSPFGVGVMLALAYMLRIQQYSKTFLAAMFVMLIGFSIGIYSILTSPMLK